MNCQQSYEVYLHPVTALEHRRFTHRTYVTGTRASHTLLKGCSAAYQQYRYLTSAPSHAFTAWQVPAEALDSAERSARGFAYLATSQPAWHVKASAEDTTAITMASTTVAQMVFLG